jgi:tetratricopeptide (TPR) repeat protein
MGPGGAILIACAGSSPPAQSADAESAASLAAPAAGASDLAELIRATWTFDEPKASEQRFRALSARALASGDMAGALQFETQVARAQGLDQRFAEADATLAGVEAKLAGQPAVVRVRWLLERGRVLNSSAQPELARPLFLRAMESARAAQLEGLTVDAAHMVAITYLSQPDEAIAWNDRALELARASAQPDARRWLGSLLNNQGWSYYDKGDVSRALRLFEEALAYRQTQTDEQATRVAKWCVGKVLRVLGETRRALEIQDALLAAYSALGKPSGVVLEELAECHQALGDRERAKGYFARAYAELSKDKDFAQHEGARLERLGRLGGAL